ncbi:molecular chaperone [Providencia rettgeri]|uniref:fimbrial biogenesis chaperone n=1 Tax=Providencia rettgeri TaxID=587 RepID=UPI0015EBB1E2|nr:fimbria/pilus periplasmic chaperone [Providencia rettgeri]QLR06110.1 fimbria/pilus periplasmic chaperone [Providencia rettgeri]
MKYIAGFFVVASLMITSECVGNTVKYPAPVDIRVRLKSDKNLGYLNGSLAVNNPGEKVWLIQSWLEDADNKHYQYVYPPLARIEPNGSVNLKVYFNTSNGKYIPEWLYVKFIPTKEKLIKNGLVFPVTYKLKVFTDK